MIGTEAQTPAALALLSIDTWPHPVFFLQKRPLLVVWTNSYAESGLRQMDASLSFGRIRLAQEQLQPAFEKFLSAADADGLSWALAAVRDRQPVVLRCRTIGESGFIVLSVFLTGSGATSLPDLVTLFELTPAEARVVEGLVFGLRAELLAKELKISIETVRTHIRRIYNKLRVVSREELIAKVNAYRVP